MIRPASIVLFSLCTLVSCGGPEPKPKEAAKPPEPTTGLSALFQMYTSARSWASDIQVLRVTSLHIGDLKPEPGKAAGWQVIFASPSLGQSRTYTYSATEISATLHQGIRAGDTNSWSPTSSSKPFLIAAAKIDSPKAHEVALTKAADYEKKHPGMPISYVLELTSRYPDAAWRVIWGESAGTSDFSILVDASTGAYIETIH